jgi:cytochrome P450
MVVYDPYDWNTQENPYPVYQALRDNAPLYRNDKLEFWALSRHADVLAAFRDHETYSSAQGPALEPLDRAATDVASFLAMDPPRHDAFRATIWRLFSKRKVQALEPKIRELSSHYLGTFQHRGCCDFIADFSGKLPMDVISDMLGIPKEDRDTIRSFTDIVVHREAGQSRVPLPSILAGTQLLAYFGNHLAKRRKDPQNDITDLLIAAEEDGHPLAEKDIIALLFLMAIAGNETTTKLLGNALYWLAEDPTQRKMVQEDPSLIPAWVEETLRFDPSSQMVARTATRDVELHGKTIKKGDRVALLIGSANRDERAYKYPNRFDITRQNDLSLAFGHGVHYCLGASLARLEGKVCLEEVMKTIPDYKIVHNELIRVHSPNVRGFASLPLRFTATS